MVPVAELAKHWPEAVNRELAELNLLQGQCELPLAQIGRSVKQGVIHMTWHQVREWIRPAPSQGFAEDSEDVTLELPLKLIASLTLSHGRFGPTKKKASPAAPEPAVPAVPAPKPAPVQQAPAAEPVRVALSTVSGNFPAELRAELAQLKKTDVVFPREKLQASLKTGKAEFTWSDLRAWLSPTVPTNVGAKHNQAMLELPLPLLVPLLFSNRSTSAPKRASELDAIPDVFNTSEKQAPAPAPESEKAVAEASPAPLPLTNDPKDLAELFNEPGKRNWTPNEIVHKTTLLPGVQGALIALQDGLLVANCMPPDWKTETIAAFMPQIFGRMNQYVKELKMGELRSVTLTVEQGTLQIFNAGIIYFAALAQQGATLPLSLTLIARELSRHTR